MSLSILTEFRLIVSGTLHTAVITIVQFLVSASAISAIVHYLRPIIAIIMMCIQVTDMMFITVVITDVQSTIDQTSYRDSLGQTVHSASHLRA
jgi:hypothetical protein